ncbi:deoxyguanosinetriphosphate triphosphohydrolase [Desulfitobacterium hafniense]|uniref:HD/PDEase domain-containing protein n=1 Tax=Desulfitobacterium hafniense (strain Y51) TaxID=138119 RepID=Q24SB4_DESHY|nr:deoxyguanosinetriphosphate triphosphohydrolase [Desulfitobacterium hafniense]BAE85078.1 hypothetical protein DSY3289 [Desulfitobacterium hafniense Y51]
MEWDTLLSTQKLIDEDPEPREFDQYPINAFEKDYSKIVSSAVFRRLQDKTQVFPLDKSDFIRTRLTHSIEVSTIARQMGIMISKNKTKYRPKDIDNSRAENIASVLLCAGLLHDLGNPPFGHFGETTIGEWFQEHLGTIKYKDVLLKDWLNKQMINDLENFEGNAQALRILSKAQHNSEINLSAAIISTLVKYPTSSISFKRDHPDIKKHKLGYYFAENAIFNKISEVVGTKNEKGEIYRHPLTHMLEAADDIAYATADLEDAFKKRLFTLDEFITYFESCLDREKAVKNTNPDYYSLLLINTLKDKRGKQHNLSQDSKVFKEWIIYIRRWLMYTAVYRFSRSYSDIMAGDYTNDLFHDTNHSKTIRILKDSMNRFVFNSSGILKLELASQTILSFLLDKFVHAALYYDYAEGEFRPTKADKKYMNIFSDNYKQDYNSAKTSDEVMDLYLRLLMVTDYISGMTDSYARMLYRELSGIE